MRSSHTSLILIIALIFVACLPGLCQTWQWSQGDPPDVEGWWYDYTCDAWKTFAQLHPAIYVGQNIAFRIGTGSSAIQTPFDIDEFTDPYPDPEHKLKCKIDVYKNSQFVGTAIECEIDAYQIVSGTTYYVFDPYKDYRDPVTDDASGTYIIQWVAWDDGWHYPNSSATERESIPAAIDWPESQSHGAQLTVVVKNNTYTYTDNGDGTNEILFANGTRCKYTYDERYRLRQIRNANTDNSAMTGAVFNYTVDGTSNRTEIWRDESETNKKLYGYDQINRLTSAGATSYSYDWVGNRGQGTGTSYDNADRLLSPGSNTYYGTGSLQSGGVPARSYTYDFRELLSTVTY